MSTQPRTTTTFIKWGLIALVLAAVLWLHAAILMPFVLSLALAYVTHPAVDRMVAWKWPRALASTVCLIAILMVGMTLLVLLAPIVSKLTPMLRDQLPDMLGHGWSVVAPWLMQVGVHVPATPEDLKTQLGALVQSHISQWSGAIWQSLLVSGSGLVDVGGLLVLVPMLTFYWLLDWPRLAGHVISLLPPRSRGYVKELLNECDSVLGQYLRGQVLVMLILAVYYSATLSFSGFTLGLPIGVLTGLIICIPYLGYSIGLILALLAGVLQYGALSQGLSYPLLVVAGVYGVGQVLESFFLTPRLVGERIGMHPMGVIFALMLFGQWLGLLGVLIALPVSALLMVLGHRVLRAYKASQFYLGQ